MTLLYCDDCNEPMRPQTAVEAFPSLVNHPKANEPMEIASLVGYSSPEGHKHDDNCLTRNYICSNGHNREISKQRTCPTCDWIGRTQCFCHADTKVKEWPEAA